LCSAHCKKSQFEENPTKYKYYAMQKYIAETRIANKSDVCPNTPRADEANL
jgi:hypothetical protein